MQTIPCLQNHSPDSRAAGFSTPQIIYVLAAGFSLFACLFPWVQEQAEKKQAKQVAKEIRILAEAFRRYHFNNNSWPEDQRAAESSPKKMEDYLDPAIMTKASPIGGHYNFDRNCLHFGKRPHAVLTIRNKISDNTTSSQLNTNQEQLTIIDRLIDDGNLLEGRFQLGHQNHPIFVLKN